MAWEGLRTAAAEHTHLARRIEELDPIKLQTSTAHSHSVEKALTEKQDVATVRADEGNH